MPCRLPGLRLSPRAFPALLLQLAPFALLAAGCSLDDRAPSRAEPWFEDVAEEAGLSFLHVGAPTPQFYFPEIMSGGAAWIDFDRDGWLDLYLVQGGGATADGRPTVNRLYRNRADGSFVDVTTESGAGDGGYGMGAAVGDFDRDGDEDLYVTNVGENRLLRNDGDGRFTDVTALAGVGDPGWGSAATFLDYDSDGDLDLFVVNYIVWSAEQEIECYSGGRRDYCLPANYETPATDVLYRNAGDGTFLEVTEAAGLHLAKGNGLGVAPADFDQDGDIDLYVANDGLPNQLWVNNGDGTFADQALISGTAVNRQGLSEASMGVVATDLDGNGQLDLLLTHLRDETNTLYLNRNGQFEDATIQLGLAAPSIESTGFGVGSADFDHDGRLDLFIANGRVGITRGSGAGNPLAEPDHLYRGLAEGGFELVAADEGFGALIHSNSRAAAFADYDNDGDIDVLVVTNGDRIRLLRNRVGSHGGWIQFRLLDETGLEVSGALVRLIDPALGQARQAQRTFGYQTANDPRVHFGLGAINAVREVRVDWPGGDTETFGPLEGNRVHTLRRGTGTTP